MTEVRRFMGLEGFYRNFVRNFSKIAYVITSLQRKGKKFVWTEKCQSSFEYLKEKLTIAPILKVPNLQKKFVLITDASRGVGGVLM